MTVKPVTFYKTMSTAQEETSCRRKIQLCEDLICLALGRGRNAASSLAFTLFADDDVPPLSFPLALANHKWNGLDGRAIKVRMMWGYL